MKKPLIWIPTETPPLKFAKQHLNRLEIDTCENPQDDVTHLMLNVPSFLADGTLRSGGSVEDYLQQLPKNACIIGGNLQRLTGIRPLMDLLQDAQYTAQNAAITAHCAIKRLFPLLPGTLQETHVLVIGWGRIGKCLAKLLRGLDAQVCVAVRKEADLAILRALGYTAISIESIKPEAYDVIFNTAPAMLLPKCSGTAIKIELSSVDGIEANDVILARGLPGKDAPADSGKLIARTVARLLRKEEEWL